MAVGLLLTENGLAIKEIAANEETAEVMGAVITDDAMIAGAAVATADGVAYQIVGATSEGVATEVGVITAEGAVIVDAVALVEAARDRCCAGGSGSRCRGRTGSAGSGGSGRGESVAER